MKKNTAEQITGISERITSLLARSAETRTQIATFEGHRSEVPGQLDRLKADETTPVEKVVAQMRAVREKSDELDLRLERLKKLDNTLTSEAAGMESSVRGVVLGALREEIERRSEAFSASISKSFFAGGENLPPEARAALSVAQGAASDAAIGLPDVYLMRLAELQLQGMWIGSEPWGALQIILESAHEFVRVVSAKSPAVLFPR